MLLIPCKTSGLLATLLLLYAMMAPNLSMAVGTRPPNLDLVITPHLPTGEDAYINVLMTIQEPDLSKGDALVQLPSEYVGIRTILEKNNAMAAHDSIGPLLLTRSLAPRTAEGTYQRWSVSRSTKGDVVVSFRAPTRHVTASTNNGPLFDMRSESGGLLGAGLMVLPTPVSLGLYSVKLRWDLTSLPPGAVSAWSLGDGDVRTVMTPQLLSFSFYAVGALKTYASDRLKMYWLSAPTFDVDALGDWIDKLYDYMSKFFDDPNSSYQVFIRQNPYEGLGGTAMEHSFMFGYHPSETLDLGRLKGVLSHEIAHTWPVLDGAHGDTAWYSEGTAEYYSLLLAYRAGLLPLSELVLRINERAAGYYTSPSRQMDIADVSRLFWSDPVMQKDPYGRGFVYLVQTNAAIEAKSGGAHSLDNVVLELNRRRRDGKPAGIAEWLDLVGREIGPAVAKREYELMKSGGPMELPSSAFGSCFKVSRETRRVFQLGFVRSSAGSDAVVRDLKPLSAAARAGLKNGDRIIRAPDISRAWADENAVVTGTFERRGKQFSVTWLPRGDDVAAYRWEATDELLRQCKPMS